MTKGPNYLLRGARNTLLDMLLESRGTTFPLADLPTSTPADMVYFNTSGTVKVNYQQPDVSYQIFEGNTPYSEVCQSDSRTHLLLDTTVLTGESHAFTVVATKLFGPAPLLSKVLYNVVNIKVGVNMNLEVVAGKTLLTFNEKNTLTIKNPQERAIYYICANGNAKLPLSAEILCEKNEDLTIETTDGLKEDITLAIAVSDPHTKSSGILNMQIPVKVKPDLHLPVTWLVNNADETNNIMPALEYRGRAVIRLQNSQKSATYRLFIKETDGSEADGQKSWISRELRGTDGDLDLSVTGTLTEDIIIGVTARKAESVPDGADLTAVVIIPVKPNANVKLKAIAARDPEDKNVSIQINGAQLGIIYQLYQQDGDKPIGEPAFYHRNLGIGNTRVSGDYIANHYKVADGIANWVDSEFVIGDVEIEDKKILLLSAGEIETTTTFYVIAKKSTTGFAERLSPVTVTVS